MRLSIETPSNVELNNQFLSHTSIYVYSCGGK